MAPLKGHQIVFRDTNQCLAVVGDSTATGADTTLATCDPAAPGQVFAFDSR
ncbi:ricin-type beta-trefoil lectin domain protein [Bailinhaonella thermotolerans]|uniref:ricin-type beta-trefoil lectin domain protein n=1 Tax=Bailinhaonella thermotolerans TaxID=1070861 RepID=UPI0011C3BAD6|nr:ricin-type beta-trefoil lectin domain protein [Bailinhaonella thermotolerans]